MTRREILQWLLDGNRVAKVSWLGTGSPIKCIEYDINTILTLVYKDGMTEQSREVFVNTDEWIQYTEPEWYDDIPSQGTICYVDNTTVDIIYSYNKTTRKFSGLYREHNMANPMAPVEIELLYITQQ